MTAYAASENTERTSRETSLLPRSSSGQCAWPRCDKARRSFREERVTFMVFGTVGRSTFRCGWQLVLSHWSSHGNDHG
ncbi:MAG: hypothetical protein JWM95_1487 [Gemmatimonadetes bacterium]|nr:hypothetical protein [Gemmatimonadota bacterium]